MFTTTHTNSAITNRMGPDLFPHRSLTKFERFIGHEDFRLFLAWSTKVKAIYSCFVAQTVPSSSEILTLCEIRQGEDDLHDMAYFIQSRCIRAIDGRNFVPHIHFIPKGAFADVDSWIESSIVMLDLEFKRCMDWYVSESFMQPLMKTTYRAPKMPRLEYDYSDDARNEAIAVKYAKFQTDILTNWVIDNVSHPFPNPEQVKELTELTGLNSSQIINWTTNVRKRNMKATIDGTKKPHHFLDFLFLASYREKNGTMPPRRQIKLEDDDSCDGEKKIPFSKPIRSKRRNARKGFFSKKKGLAVQNILPKQEFPVIKGDIVALPIISTESAMPPMSAKFFPFDMSKTLNEEMAFTRVTPQTGLFSNVPSVTPPKSSAQHFETDEAHPNAIFPGQAQSADPMSFLPPVDMSNHQLTFDDMSHSDLYLEELNKDVVLANLHTRAFVKTPIDNNTGDTADRMSMYNYNNTFERRDTKESFEVPQQGLDTIGDFKNYNYENNTMRRDNEESFNAHQGQEMIENLMFNKIESFEVPPGQHIKKELFENFSFDRPLEQQINEELSRSDHQSQGMIIDNVEDASLERVLDLEVTDRLEECGVDMEVDEFLLNH